MSRCPDSRRLQGRQFTERSLPINTADEILIRGTKKKLANILFTISQLKAEDFPHDHSSDALEALEAKFNECQCSLNAIDSTTLSTIVKSLCMGANQIISDFLPVLGFLIRSTHVRNAFELHGPVLRLVHKALGSSAKLVLSSEWMFSPFTWLLPPLDSRRYVMIGLPASESSNGLIIPLAGHELGHSIWVQEKLTKRFSNAIEDAIVANICGPKWDEFRAHFPDVTEKNQVNDIIGRPLWSLAWQWAIKQCEELYCDFIGINIFGSSYMYAFAYLLAPGFGEGRPEKYPSLPARAEAFVKAANKVGAGVPPEFRSLFEAPAKLSKDMHDFLLSLSDDATSSLLDKLIEGAYEFCKSQDLISGQDDVQPIVKAFKKLVPAVGAKSLASIINAGWQVYINEKDRCPDSYKQLIEDRLQQEIVINDLVLKTVEVFEIEQHQITP